MNAIVALCHFCPEHGPRTLFCTQTFKYSDLPNYNNSNNNANIEKSSSSDLKHTNQIIFQQYSASGLHQHVQDTSFVSSSNHNSSDSTTNLPDRSNNLKSHSQSSSPTQSTITTSNKSNSLDKTWSNCRPCRAFDSDFHHYISYEKTTNANCDLEENHINNNICYVSQSEPSDTEVFSLVRKACLRTLHCEVFEDPIYFDDDKNGSVIGYEFNIKDSEGRGQQRSYSLIIIMKDRIYLQHLWSFLSKQISIIASNIKQLAQKKFEKDIQNQNNENSKDNNNVFAFSSSSNPTTSGSSSSSTSMMMSFRKHYQRDKKSSKQSRGLIELTDDKFIFAKLHMWFTWILRMSSCLISEDMVTGPIDEDSQIKLEREQLNELFNNDSPSRNISINHSKHGLKSDLGKSLSDYSISYFSNQNFDSNNEDILSDDNNYSHNDNENFLNTMQCDSLKQLLKLIGFVNFHQIAYHTIIGNQVIVRGKYKRLVSSIIKILEELIPLGCCKSVYYSNEYLKSYQCKLLGLSDQCNLFKEEEQNSQETNRTNHVYSDLNEYILLDLFIKQRPINNFKNEDNNFISCPLLGSSLVDLINERNELVVSLKTNCSQMSLVPSFLNKVESYLLNDKLDDLSISCLIKQAKEEWLNKTKVFYKFTQTPSVQTKISTDDVLKMLNLSKNDELALRHWQAGLSNECKVQIRTS